MMTSIEFEEKFDAAAKAAAPYIKEALQAILGGIAALTILSGSLIGYTLYCTLPTELQLAVALACAFSTTMALIVLTAMRDQGNQLTQKMVEIDDENDRRDNHAANAVQVIRDQVDWMVERRLADEEREREAARTGWIK